VAHHTTWARVAADVPLYLAEGLLRLTELVTLVVLHSFVSSKDFARVCVVRGVCVVRVVRVSVCVRALHSNRFHPVRLRFCISFV
jgi:hypothetical protein